MQVTLTQRPAHCGKNLSNRLDADSETFVLDGQSDAQAQAGMQIEACQVSGNAPNNLLAVNTAPTFVLHVGRLTTDIAAGSSDRGNSVELQADGKILLGGRSGSYTDYDFRFAVVRYNSNGSLDTSFGGDAIVTTDFDTGSFDSAYSIAVQEDGKILLGGTSGDKFALARYNSNGSLDTSFNGIGKLTTSAGLSSTVYTGGSVTVQADGKILLAGGSYVRGSTLLDAHDFDFALIRYNSDGRLDTSFDGDGKLTTDIEAGSFDSGYSISLQAGGKILLGGHGRLVSRSGGDFALARYHSDGSLDTTFDGDGKLTTEFDSGASAQSVTVQTDGKILLGGDISDQFALARYNASGSLDITFDGDGKLTTEFDSTASALSVAVQADGKILLGGYSGGNFALARYNANGGLDTTFDGDGKLTTGFGSGASVAVQEDGKILLGGSSGSDFALLRYNNDGSPDTHFGSPINTLLDNPQFREASRIYPSQPVVLAGLVQIGDTELASAGNYNGATLALQRHGAVSPQDVFSAASSALTTLTTGGTFAVDGISIGHVMVNDAGTLALVFNAQATQVLVNKAMQQIAYANSSDAPPASVQIDWTFNDGNTGAQGTGGAMSTTGSSTVQITATNDEPMLNHALMDQNLSVNTPFRYTIPVDAFTDPDLDTLSYSIRMSDGSVVPPWLTFTSATRTFFGTPTVDDVGDLDIVVIARDSGNVSATDTLRLSVSATSFADTLTGTAANESFTGGPGNDTINGAGGIDIANYSSNFSNYTVTKSGSTYTVTDKTGADGIDTLTHIETLRFTDLSVNLQIQGLAAAAPQQADVDGICELYVAFFNRIPDADGLAYWIGQHAAGQSISQMSELFYHVAVSPSYASLTGFSTGMTDEDFIHLFYKNVLGRPEGADAGGLAYWNGKLANHESTRSSLVNDILGSAHTFKGDAAWGWVADLLDNKLAVARTIAIDWGLTYNSDVYAKGVDIAAAVTPTDTSFALGLVGVNPAVLIY